MGVPGSCDTLQKRPSLPTPDLKQQSTPVLRLQGTGSERKEERQNSDRRQSPCPGPREAALTRQLGSLNPELKVKPMRALPWVFGNPGSP